jgi:hypothetical protein
VLQATDSMVAAKPGRPAPQLHITLSAHEKKARLIGGADMTAALISALLALNPSPPPPDNPDPFRGTQESSKLNHSSSGFTLDKLQGLPMTRPVYSPPQPQVWYYQPYAVYPASSPGLGGYMPPGTGRSYSPLSLGFGWGWWW